MIDIASLKRGWNLGNTFDAFGGETGWGNPRTTREMIDFVAQAGFDVLRVPVTWKENMGAAPNYRLNANFLLRVREVIQWGLDAGMTVILNTHHEGAWLKPSTEYLDKIEPRFIALWRQIAEYFGDMDERLMFEGMNEPRLEGTPNEWFGGDSQVRRAINVLNRLFVETVRATGGNNLTRGLLITTCGAQVNERGLKDMIVPADDNLILSLHSYCPDDYAFDRLHGRKIFDESVDADIGAMFDTLVKFAKPLNLPIIMTEYGAVNKKFVNGKYNDEDNAKWARAFLSRAKALGIPCVWWDNGYFDSGDEHFALLDRINLRWYMPETVEAIIETTK